MIQPLNPKNSSVLVVEDNPEDATIVGRAVEAFGIHKILVAATGEEALGILEETGGCDVVLLDYNLPGMNGLRVLEQIRESWPRMPVVLVTGVRDESIAVAAMKAGAADYIAKDDLLTSHVIGSLQAALRSNIASDEEDRRTTLSAGVDKLPVAIEEGKWLLEMLRGHDSTPARHVTEYGQEDHGDLLQAFSLYLKVSFTCFPNAAQKEQAAIARMFMDRGSSPAEIMAVYVASLRALMLESLPPPFNPALTLVQLLAHVVNEYQLTLSLSALEARNASVASPGSPASNTSARAA